MNYHCTCILHIRSRVKQTNDRRKRLGGFQRLEPAEVEWAQKNKSFKQRVKIVFFQSGRPYESYPVFRKVFTRFPPGITLSIF